MIVSHGMRLRLAAALITVLSASGCASMLRPAYCDVMFRENVAIMAAKADWDVAWIATAYSQTGYDGDCACPNHKDSRGHRCGDRSAYARSGGAMPMCTPEDVPPSILPAVRHTAAVEALPFECGGIGSTSALTF